MPISFDNDSTTPRDAARPNRLDDAPPSPLPAAVQSMCEFLERAGRLGFALELDAATGDVRVYRRPDTTPSCLPFEHRALVASADRRQLVAREFADYLVARDDLHVVDLLRGVVYRGRETELTLIELTVEERARRAIATLRGPLGKITRADADRIAESIEQLLELCRRAG